MPRFVSFAAAAAVVLSVGSFIYFGPTTSRVEAATILTSLRTSLWDSLRIELRQIEADGVAVDGEMEIHFEQPVSMAGIFDGSQDVSVRSGYGHLAILAGDDAEPDMLGLDMTIEGGFGADATWAFVDLRGLPEELHEEPGAAFVLGMLQGGVLLQLDGLLDGDDTDDAAPADDTPQPGSDDGLVIDMRISTDDRDSAGASDESSLVVKPNVTLSFDDGDEQLGELVETLLRGRASPEDLLALADRLEDSADITVLNMGDGAYVLRAENIEGDEDTADTIIEIGYAEGTGVEWLEVSNVEGTNGVVRVALSDAPPTDHVAIRDEMLENGVRNLDIAALLRSFGGDD